jgi:hypothetical protein
LLARLWRPEDPAQVRFGLADVCGGIAGPWALAPLWGGGAERRKRLTETDPGLVEALDALVEPETRGDPMTRLRWTTRSTRNLAGELRRQGHAVSHHSVARLLATELDYSLQANAKTVEGVRHPDRDAQFQYIKPPSGTRSSTGCSPTSR